MRERIDLNTPSTLEIFDNGNRARVKARILRTGIFTSGINGHTFDIKMEHLVKTKNKYNGRLKEYVKSLFRNSLPEYELQQVQMAPNCVEHNINDEFVVGRIIGELYLEDDPITKTTWLWATLEVLGFENVEKIRDGRRKAVSINFNTNTCELVEISFVAEGAIPDACVMSAQPQSNMVQYTENDQINSILSKIENIDKSIDNKYTQITKLRKESDLLDNRIQFTKKLQSLVKSCQLTKADMKRILWTIDDDASKETLNTVNAVLSKLPKCVDTRQHKYSVDDFKLREYLMNKKELTSDEVLAKLNQVVIENSAQFKKPHPEDGDKYTVEASKHGSLENKAEHEQKHATGSDHEIMLKHEHVEKLKTLLSEGKHDEAHAFLCSMTEKHAELTKDHEGIESDESKKLEEEKKRKHAELKKHEDDMEHERKEKAELKAQLDKSNAQLSALTGALNKIINKGE